MKNYYLLIVLFLLAFGSCSDETTIIDQQSQGNALFLEANSTILQNSIEAEANRILPIYFKHEDYDESAIEKNGKFSLHHSLKNRKFSKNDSISIASGDFHLNLVGQVQPPSFDEYADLAATHVDYQNDFAYVSYNIKGEVYAGAVDIINLNNPLKPVLTSRMYMYDRDANVILFDNGYLYVIGGVDMEKVLEATGESFIAKIGVNNGIIDLDDVNYFYQEGQTATAITKLGNSFYVSSGAEGVIAKYDGDTFLKSNESTFSDLLWVASSDDKIAILDGNDGVRILDTELNEVSQIDTKTDLLAGAKRTIAIADDKLIVSEGADGAAIFNLDTGILEERLPILIDPENVSDSDKVTNAVAVEANTTLLANGGAGLAIRVENDIIDLMGVVELNGSINYVTSNDDFIFAASGTKGLQIINKIRTQESLVIPEGDYIIKARHSGRAVGLSSLSLNDNININQRTLTGVSENEKWHVEVLDSGAYLLTSQYSDKAMASLNRNTKQEGFGSEANQQWVIEPAAEEGYFYLRNLGDNRYLDVYRRRTTFGTNIITWPYHGNTNQQWQFERLED